MGKLLFAIKFNTNDDYNAVDDTNDKFDSRLYD